MNTITRVGVDLAKYLVQVHAVDAAGKLRHQACLETEKVPALVHSSAGRRPDCDGCLQRISSLEPQAD